MDSSNRTSGNGVLYVRAQHVFRGKNNDELSFNVGDVIAITQQVEGGWWEGTLNGETGWFPSAYVNIITEKDKLLRSRSIPNSSVDSPAVNGNSSDAFSTKKQFIVQVLDSFIKSETEYILNLKKIVEDYLAPLSSSDIVSENEFNTIEGEVSKIFAHQASVFKKIVDMKDVDLADQRIGGLFITSAPELKELLTGYCSNHPDAVQVITDKNEDLASFFTSRGGDMRTFIQGLSEPFRHLKAYPGTLQELHRNMPETHPDRGDIHRSCAVFRDIKELCEWTRRQREMQIDFLAAPRVKRFVDEEVPGDICRMGVASVSRGDELQEDRTLALFPSYLALFELSPDAIDYTLHELISIDRLRMRKTTIDGKNVLITNKVPEEITLEFSSSYDLDRWIEAFIKCGVSIDEENNEQVSSPSTVPYEVKKRVRKESGEEALDMIDAALASQSFEFARLRNKQQTNIGSTPTSSTSSSSMRKPKNSLDDSLPFRVNHELEMILPDGFDDSEENDDRNRRNESSFYIRHYPPYRIPNNNVDLGKKAVKMRKDQQGISRDQGDATLLSIVEGYLGVGGDDNDRRGRGGEGSMRNDVPQLIVADEEKLLIEEIIDGQTVMTEKSLVDVVYALKDQMDSMAKDMAALRLLVEKEQRARRRLEDSMKRSSLHLNTSTPKPLLDTST